MISEAYSNLLRTDGQPCSNQIIFTREQVKPTLLGIGEALAGEGLMLTEQVDAQISTMLQTLGFPIDPKPYAYSPTIVGQLEMAQRLAALDGLIHPELLVRTATAHGISPDFTFSTGEAGATIVDTEWREVTPPLQIELGG